MYISPKALLNYAATGVQQLGFNVIVVSATAVEARVTPEITTSVTTIAFPAFLYPALRVPNNEGQDLSDIGTSRGSYNRRIRNHDFSIRAKLLQQHRQQLYLQQYQQQLLQLLMFQGRPRRYISTRHH
jgi:hypothetical protein